MRDSLKFLCELPIYQEEQPYQLVGYADQEATPQGENCVFEAKEIDVQDAREHPVTLQTHGFAFFQFKSGCELAARHFETVGGDNSILTKYLDETVEFVRKMFKPVDIICFDWRLRRRDPTTGPGIPPRDLKDIRNYALPSGDVVHCDYSADGGFDRLKIQLLPDELAEYMKKGRKGMIVNVWRPLNKVVCNAPLLFCDRRTVPKEDLVEVDKVLPDKVEKSYFLYHRDYHQWYTLVGHRCDEVVVFPTWKSDDMGEDFASCCPHGAGASHTDSWADPRESVEVRLLLIMDNSMEAKATA